jgi:hypothetical protein
VEASLDDQKVTVTGDDSISGEMLLDAIRKWADTGGKAISLGSEESV